MEPAPVSASSSPSWLAGKTERSSVATSPSSPPRRLGLAAVPVAWLDISVDQARLLGLAFNKTPDAG